MTSEQRVWYLFWCATHAMLMTTNDRCWGSPPPEGECERIKVWVVEQKVDSKKDTE